MITKVIDVMDVELRRFVDDVPREIEERVQDVAECALFDAISYLTPARLLNKALAKLRDLQSGSKVRQFFQQEVIAGNIRDIQDDIQHALSLFTVCSALLRAVILVDVASDPMSSLVAADSARDPPRESRTEGSHFAHT